MDEKAQQLAVEIREAQDCLSRAFECLAKEDLFGAALQLHKMRTIVNSMSSALPERKPEGTRDLSHDWRVADPYTAQCRICGKQRPLGTVFYPLDPLQPLASL